MQRFPMPARRVDEHLGVLVSERGLRLDDPGLALVVLQVDDVVNVGRDVWHHSNEDRHRNQHHDEYADVDVQLDRLVAVVGVDAWPESV